MKKPYLSLVVILLLSSSSYPVQSQIDEGHQLVPNNGLTIGSDGYDHLIHKTLGNGNNSYLTGFLSYPLYNTRSLYPGPFYGDSDFVQFPDTENLEYKGGNKIPIASVDQNMQLISSTYLGGDRDEVANDIQMTKEGYLGIVGRTTSKVFINGTSEINTQNQGENDGFILTFDPNSQIITSLRTLGGDSYDEIHTINFLSDGSYIVVGSTNSLNFPLVNAFDEELLPKNNQTETDSRIPTDIFITKFRSNGSIEFSTLMGGSEDEMAKAIQVYQDEIYISGYTRSNDFPTKATINEETFGGNDGFISKLSINGSLIKSTYVGGKSNDAINDMKVANGRIYLIGNTYSSDFPTTRGVSGVDTTLNDPSVDSGIYSDGFYLVLDLNFNIQISSYLGGTHAEILRSLDLDNQGNLYISGSTKSPDYPVHGPFSRPPPFNGVLLEEAEQGFHESDIAITKINSQGKVAYSTFFGGGGIDVGNNAVFKTLNDTKILSINGYTRSQLLSNVFLSYNAGKLDNSFLIDFIIPEGNFSSVPYPGVDNTTQLIIYSVLGGIGITLIGNIIYYRYKKKKTDEIRHDKYRESYDLIKEAMRED